MDRHALLAIDTSTEICSVAVCFPYSFDESSTTPVVGALSGNNAHAEPAARPMAATQSLDEAGPSVFDDRATGLRFISIERHTGSVSSGFILPAVSAVLDAAGIRLEDCGALAFGAGPGSFTGLRTATGIAQGLAFGANMQVLPVNTLMACAESARQRGTLADCTHVMAVMDARMSQCYWEVFEGSATEGNWRSLGPSAVTDPQAIALPTEALVGGVRTPGAAVTHYAVVGNGMSVLGDVAPVVAAAHRVDVQARPSASAIAAVGWREWQAGHAVAPAEALPRYVRDKVASTTLEREAERMQRAAQAATAAQAVHAHEVKS